MLFLALDLALVIAAGALLLVVIVRRGQSLRYLALAALLIALAVGVWYVGIRAPPGLP